MNARNIFLIVCISLFSYCSLDKINDPKPPKWDFEVEKIPVFSADTLRLGDELKVKDFDRIGADSLLAVTRNDEEKFYIGDKLNIPAQEKSFSDQIGTFEIEGGQSINHEIKFLELYPQLSALVGQSAPVPATAIPKIERETVFEDFLSVSIVSGGFRLDVFNQLGFVLGDNVVLDLYDVDLGQLIQRVNFGRIENLESGSYFIDLAGKTISANLKVEIYGNMVGSEGTNVPITNDAGFTITVTPQDLVADQATAKLPPQTFELSGHVDVNSDSLSVRTATIDKGSINISIDNSFQFPIQVDITIPNLKDENSQDMNVLLKINPGSRYDSEIILDNALLDLDGKDLEFETVLSIQPDASTYYTLRSDDELTVEIDISEISLAEVVGDFDIGTDFPDIEEKVFDDPPDELDNISLDNAILTMDFINSPFDEITLNIHMQANSKTETKDLYIQKTIQRGTTVVLDKNGVNGDGSSPTFIDILNLLPENIMIEGDVQVVGQNISFSKDDSLGVEYSIEVPLAFSLTNSTYGDQDSLDIDDDSRDKIGDFISSASVELTIENALPVSGSLAMLVGQDSTTINTELLSVELPSPTIDDNGLVVQPAIQTITVALNKEKFEALANAYFYKYEVELDDITLAQLTANDYIIIRDVFVSGKMLLDPDGLKDDDDSGNE